MKKILFIMFAFCLGVIDSYADRHEEDPNNTIYSSEVSVTPGGQATLTVSMKNSVEIGGFQFELYLPEGFTVDHSVDSYGDVVVNASLVENRTDLSRHTFQASFPTAGDYSHIQVLCYSSASKSFMENDGAVATIVVNVAESVEEGDYSVEYKNVVISNATDTYATAKVTSTISVGEIAPAYDEGYEVVIKSFKPVVGDSGGIIEIYYRADSNVKNMSFDVVLPKGMYFIDYEDWESGNVECIFADACSKIENKKFTIEEDTHRSVISIAGSTKKNLKETSGQLCLLATIKEYFVATQEDVDEFDWEGEIISDGISQIAIENLKVTTTESGSAELKNFAPYSADIYVGTPKASVDEDGVVAFHGDYSDKDMAELMLTAIPSDNKSVTTVDLTGVTALPENTTITTGNPNALVTTSKDLGLKNGNNVVIGNTCNNLVLTDGNDFFTPKNFTADNATYSRDMGNKWGTVVLPYQVESDENIAYYLPTEIDEEGILRLKLQENLPANTPAIVAKLNGEKIAPTYTGVQVKKNGYTPSGKVKMYGSYKQGTTITDSNAYYIKDNKFWLCNGSFKVNAFRAYFTVDGESLAKSLIIDDSITAINAIVGEGEVTVLEYFDITGKRIDGLQKGVNILKLSNGKTQKVIVE